MDLPLCSTALGALDNKYFGSAYSMVLNVKHHVMQDMQFWTITLACTLKDAYYVHENDEFLISTVGCSCLQFKLYPIAQIYNAG